MKVQGPRELILLDRSTDEIYVEETAPETLEKHLKKEGRNATVLNMNDSSGLLAKYRPKETARDEIREMFSDETWSKAIRAAKQEDPKPFDRIVILKDLFYGINKPSDTGRLWREGFEKFLEAVKIPTAILNYTMTPQVSNNKEGNLTENNTSLRTIVHAGDFKDVPAFQVTNMRTDKDEISQYLKKLDSVFRA